MKKKKMKLCWNVKREERGEGSTSQTHARMKLSSRVVESRVVTFGGKPGAHGFDKFLWRWWIRRWRIKIGVWNWNEYKKSTAPPLEDDVVGQYLRQHQLGHWPTCRPPNACLFLMPLSPPHDSSPSPVPPSLSLSMYIYLFLMIYLSHLLYVDYGSISFLKLMFLITNHLKNINGKLYQMTSNK